MNSPTANSSPKFKNLICKSKKQSPIEIKEKMRKNYRDKIQNCRNMLLNKFRGPNMNTEIQNSLNDIYKNMFKFTDIQLSDEEELEVLEEVKKELMQEELQWLLEEYEKSQTDNTDWSAVHEDNNLICPVCEKFNCTLQNRVLYCPNCKSSIKTEKTLEQIKAHIFNLLEKHGLTCSNDVQFNIVPDVNDSHIYLICEGCMEMQMVV